MKKLKRSFASIFVMLFLFTNVVFGEDFVKNEEFLDAIKEYILTNYAGEVSEEELYDGAVRGMFDKLDAHSIYMDKETSDDFNEEVSGKLYGIGALIGLRNGKVKIIEPLDDSPAKKAGLLPGDIIIGVDGEEFKEVKDTDTVLSKIKGDKGTEVILTIDREGKKFDTKLIRDEVKINPIKHKVIKGDLGYLKIGEFNANATKSTTKAIEELKKNNVKKLVLDLRGNPGGRLIDVVNIADYFVPKGKVVTIRDAKGNYEEYNSSGDLAFEKIVVLIDNGSASASEILAGAVQDTKAGMLVGEKSYGKGTVQKVLPLRNGESVKLTIAKYYLPSDRTIDHTGIVPDIEASRFPESLNLEEMQELKMDKKLAKNEAGLDVLGLQERLSILGYKISDAQGIFGESTENAVKAFQRDNNLYTYGAADLTTLEKINEKFGEYMLSEKMDNQLNKAIEILSK